MKDGRFRLILLFITLLGLTLRLHDYTKVPALGETRDELMYPWAGMTFIQTGTPSSWSYFDSYKNRQSITLWDQEFRIVTPWFDKPLLYPILTGSWVLLTGARSFGEVTLDTLRLVPIILGTLTIALTGLVARKVFSPRIGLVAAILYATVPSIILANRLSLTENLLTPLVLSTILLLTGARATNLINVILSGVLAGLAFHTKQIGAVVILCPVLFFLIKREYKALFVVAGTFAVFVALHFLIVAYYDLGLYLKVMSDFRHAHALVGLPELIPTLFRYPGIGQKTRLFLDGAILSGLILMFTSPWLMGLYKMSGQTLLKLSSTRKTQELSQVIFLVFPFAYVALLTTLESGATAFSYFGWHIYPLYPFLMTFLALVLVDIYENFYFIKLFSLSLILGSSSIRFIFLIVSRSLTHRWQYVFVGFMMAVASFWFLSPRLRRIELVCLFLIFVLINIYTIIHLKEIYPTTAAHLDSIDGLLLGKY